MNPIEELGERIRGEVPRADIQIELPAEGDGVWFLTVKLGDPVLSVQWKAVDGFGLSSLPTEGLGDAPDERYSDFEDTASRVVHLLREGKRTQAGRQPSFTGL